MSTEKETISNEWHELEHVAKKMNVPVSTVVLAKEQTGSNDRKIIEDWIWSAPEHRPKYSK